MTLFALFFATGLHRSAQQRSAVARFRELGFKVYYDYHFDSSLYDDECTQNYCFPTDNANPRIPQIVEKYVGVDFFHSVVALKTTEDRLPLPPNAQLPFEKLPHLKRLDWRGSNELELISKARNLEELTIRVESQDPVDLSPISKFSQLRYLSMQFSDVSDLTPLSNLRRLRHLDICGTEVKSLAGLENLHELEEIYFKYCQIDNLLPIQKLNQIKALIGGPSSGSIKSLDGVAGLSSLETLVANTQTTDLSDFSNCKKLQALTLRKSDVVELDSKKLGASDGRVVDLAPLASCVLLEQLDIDCNRSVTSLEPLARMKLTGLVLDGASISDLSPLAKLPLAELQLYDCKLKKLNGIGSITSLTHLNVENNQITDYSLIQKLPNLTWLAYWTFPPSDVSPEIATQIKALEAANPNLDTDCRQ